MRRRWRIGEGQIFGCVCCFDTNIGPPIAWPVSTSRPTGQGKSRSSIGGTVLSTDRGIPGSSTSHNGRRDTKRGSGQTFIPLCCECDTCEALLSR